MFDLTTDAAIHRRSTKQVFALITKNFALITIKNLPWNPLLIKLKAWRTKTSSIKMFYSGQVGYRINYTRELSGNVWRRKKNLNQQLSETRKWNSQPTKMEYNQKKIRKGNLRNKKYVLVLQASRRSRRKYGNKLLIFKQGNFLTKIQKRN